MAFRAGVAAAIMVLVALAVLAPAAAQVRTRTRTRTRTASCSSHDTCYECTLASSCSWCHSSGSDIMGSCQDISSSCALTEEVFPTTCPCSQNSFSCGDCTSQNGDSDYSYTCGYCPDTDMCMDASDSCGFQYNMTTTCPSIFDNFGDDPVFAAEITLGILGFLGGSAAFVWLFVLKKPVPCTKKENTGSTASGTAVTTQNPAAMLAGAPPPAGYPATAPGSGYPPTAGAPYGAPSQAAPGPAGYGAPAPGYGAPAPGYGAPAPGYGAPAPAPGYGAPAPGYGAPAPGGAYGAAPGPAGGGYAAAPAPAAPAGGPAGGTLSLTLVGASGIKKGNNPKAKFICGGTPYETPMCPGGNLTEMVWADAKFDIPVTADQIASESIAVTIVASNGTDLAATAFPLSQFASRAPVDTWLPCGMAGKAQGKLHIQGQLR